MLSRRAIQTAPNFFNVFKTTQSANRKFHQKVDLGKILKNNFSAVQFYSFRRFSSKVESTLTEFLKDEIEAEKKIGKKISPPDGERPSIPGFQIATDQREVTLTKRHGNETITVKFDVNRSVSTEETPDINADKSAQQEPSLGGPKMVSKPDFAVQIEKGDQKLVFQCVFDVESPDPSKEKEDYGDLFDIEGMYMYSGATDEKKKFYAVAGEIIDVTLYDHLMDYLEERGIDNAFAQHLSRFSTVYEHGQYVGLLQKLRDFVSK